MTRPRPNPVGLRPRITHLVEQNRHGVLLVSLLLTIGARPFLIGTVMEAVWVDTILVLTVGASVYATVRHRRGLALLGSLALVPIVCEFAWRVDGSGGWFAGLLVGYSVFLAVIAALLLRSLLIDTARVTTDTLSGAFATYLILGLLWSMFYGLLDLVDPGSFEFSRADVPQDSRRDRFIGFSFTTLTTLGYGNISPATPRADALTTLEAVVGQAYIVIIIARLVALEAAQGRGSRGQ